MNKKPPTPPPEDLLPARLAWRNLLILHARMLAAVEDAAHSAGVLPLPQFDLLASLAASPDHRLRLSELADAVLLTRAGLSRLVDRAQAAGLIRREACPNDKRGAFAVLTDKGLAELRRAHPVYHRTLDTLFSRHLPHPTTVAHALHAVLTANHWLPSDSPIPLTISAPKKKP